MHPNIHLTTPPKLVKDEVLLCVSSLLDEDDLDDANQDDGILKVLNHSNSNWIKEIALKYFFLAN